MPYRLKKSESVPEGLRRIVGEELSSAVDQLANSKKREEAIHEARKTIKKVRGILRLVRPHSAAIYRVENRRFRDIGRKLSELRDAASIIEAFDALLEKHKASLESGAFSGIRRDLQRSKHETEQSLNVDKTTAQAVSAFNAAHKTVATGRLTPRIFRPRNRPAHRSSEWPQDVQPGRELRNSAVSSTNSVKPSKRIGTTSVCSKALARKWSRARKVSKNSKTWLGDDHNLAVLHEKLRKSSRNRRRSRRNRALCRPALARTNRIASQCHLARGSGFMRRSHRSLSGVSRAYGMPGRNNLTA